MKPTPSKVKCDWVNCTFPKPSMSIAAFIALFSRMLGRPVSAVDDRGLIGFESSVKLFAHHGSTQTPIGCLAFGGESQRGRWMFQLTGVGCDFVRDWDGLADLLESMDGKLTRVDLALDFLEGEHGVEEAVTLYQLGGFTGGGRAPSSRLDGDWLNESAGRSFYVGKATNGKMLRVYEKGRQLGDPESAWTRFEVQLGSRDRVLPFECLTAREAFFAGCYPALASMIEEAAEFIPTQLAQGEVTLGHLLYHFKRCYGKVADVVMNIGSQNAEFIQELRVTGIPKRLNLSCLASGVSWDGVKSQMQKRCVS